MKSFDVIIIGYGPTGGTLASLLVKSNLSVLILEKEKSLYPLPRAVHFDDEIMRVFDTIGIKEKFKKFTIINKGTKFVDNKGKVLLDWPRPREITENGSYPSYRFHQPDFEKVIRNHLKGYKNFSSKQNSNVIEIKNTKNYVDIISEDTETLKQDTFRCKYLVGCDGANSITRKIINSQFDNLGFNQKWAVIDLILKKNKKLPDRTIQYANSKRPATYCRNVGKRRRWEFVIKNNENEKKVVSDSFIWDFLKPWVKSNEAKIERKAIYTFQSAIAKKWRKQRVFLAGDAAHLMPPFMGQGMCAGIRDASNLAWKINHCIKNGHNEKLLNSFQSERFSNVKEYIQTTMKMGEFINAMRSYKIADTVSDQSDGSKSMKSIKPELGPGLGLKSNKHRGKIFPKFNIKNSKSFDDIFSTEPVLIVSDNLSVGKLKSKIKIIKEASYKELSKIFKKFQVEAIIIRPDRFILETFNSRENFIKKINKTLQGII
tara:strand:+ start:132 stop:1592 length:1461 start_codon:yes stop_codon:yes gene_type:complete